jgi:hypothetical protein
MTSCVVKECDEDGIYCEACCKTCGCYFHLNVCKKQVCQLCNAGYEPWKEDSHLCTSCDGLKEVRLQCAFEQCKAVFGIQRVHCCESYFCNEHYKYQDWRKCCSACTRNSTLCIVCVKTKNCPCGFQPCVECERFFHKDQLDEEGQCLLCFHSPYYHMNVEP